jgi:hypothetical protein
MKHRFADPLPKIHCTNLSGSNQFAFVALGILPFMAFGEYMQNQQMMGEDEGDILKEAAEGSEGAVVVETLLNMRTVSSLCMEGERIETYSGVLHDKNKTNTLPRNAVKGTFKMCVCVCDLSLLLRNTISQPFPPLIFFRFWPRSGFILPNVGLCIDVLFRILVSFESWI